jgi:hypothetical protein
MVRRLLTAVLAGVGVVVTGWLIVAVNGLAVVGIVYLWP